jgi:hypothetical protein
MKLLRTLKWKDFEVWSSYVNEVKTIYITCGLWRHVIWWMSNVSEEFAASVFRLEIFLRQGTYIVDRQKGKVIPVQSWTCPSEIELATFHYPCCILHSLPPRMRRRISADLPFIPYILPCFVSTILAEVSTTIFEKLETILKLSELDISAPYCAVNQYRIFRYYTDLLMLRWNSRHATAFDTIISASETWV